ncbi:unnamed protein product [Soboliphyme baturini]|uniref:YkgJ family cysteine cluster protein n=1 Tax=Soboliphyme baturini TaxID=241478 RepID=A0A183J276_9BILA|nr:unnamed protein product [Soboliphyme baturini]
MECCSPWKGEATCCMDYDQICTVAKHPLVGCHWEVSTNIDRRVCGNADCAHCGEVCVLDKLNNSCEWTRFLTRSGFLFQKLEQRTKQLSVPHWRKQGLTILMKYLPHGECKAFGDKCKCCCHPYEVNEDGTACRLKKYCQALTLPAD